MKHADSTLPVDVVAVIEIARPHDVVAAFAADPDNVPRHLRLKSWPTGTRMTWGGCRPQPSGGCGLVAG